MWSFRLRGPKGKAAALSIAPDASVQSFCDQAAQLLALPKTKPLTFRAGFPPRVVTYSVSDEVQRVFARNDTVVVDIAASSGAAVAAPTVIQGTSSQRAPRRTAAAAASTKKAAPAKRSGIHTFSGPASQRARGSRGASSIKRKALGDGVRLGDTLDDDDDDDNAEASHASGTGTTTAEPPTKYQRTHAIHLSSKDAIAEALVNAVSHQSNDRSGKFFRAATKSALEHQYAMTLANARLNAALANRFEIHVVSTAGRVGMSSDNSDSDATKGVEMRVKFRESVRKWHEETVEMLHDVELKAVLQYVLLSGGETGKEMLKPFNMAQCSPRVFWSIARLYNGDVAAGLVDLMPDEDWSYLDTRTRVMSKKAIEAKANEAQWKRWKQESRAQEHAPAPDNASNDVIVIDDDDADTVTTATSASSRPSRTAATAASRSNAPLVATTRSGTASTTNKPSLQQALRAATARAALSRFDVAAHTADVVSAFAQVTATARDSDATDTDDDEAIEPTTTVYCDACNKARILSLDEAKQADVEADHWACANLAATERSASCDAVDDEVAQIAGETIAQMLQRADIHTRKDLADASPVKTLKRLVTPLESANATLKEKLASMIDEARLDEVNDWMSELVGDTDLVGLLELQKLGTPADLVTTPLDLIYDAVHGDDHDDVTVERVQAWREHARVLVAEHPWLADWRTL